MNTVEILYISIGVVIAAILQYYDLLFNVLFAIFLVVVAIVGVYLSVSWSLVRGKQYKPTTIPDEPTKVKELLEKMMEKKSEAYEEHKREVVSRNIDDAIREVMDHMIQDFVLTWYTDLSKDQQTVVNAIRNDAWIVVEKLTKRLSQIDRVKLVTKDVMEIMYKHFNKIRHCSSSKGPDQKKFVLHAWLANEETEVEFLRKLCDALLIILLPSHFRGCISIRHLLREIFTSSVLKPTVDMLCDPDYINRKLISYIDYRHRLSEDTKRTYTYAATYEDFIKLIDKCNDIEHLKQIRYNILTEIIHATTIDNLKKEQGMASDASSPTPGTGKGELLKARNLKRYINQLSVAKNKCEKRLHRLGGPEYKAYDLQSDTMETSQKVLSFQEVMETSSAREEFVKYLKRSDCDSLIGFWNAIETLKNMDKKLQHHQAREIYQQYIHVASSTSIVKLDKAVVKGMEEFMLGNMGPESFYEGQLKVAQILVTQHYPSFLVSDVYNRYIRSLEEGTLDLKSDPSKDSLLFKPNELFVDPEDEDEEMLASQSYEAQARLQQLDERIQNKQRALQALQASSKNDDSKIDKFEKDIEKEVENLILEKRLREAHILRTRTWIENQGQWRVHVYGAERMNTIEKLKQTGRDQPYHTPLKVKVIKKAETRKYENDGRARNATNLGLADTTDAILATCYDENKLGSMGEGNDVMLRNYIFRDKKIIITSQTVISRTSAVGPLSNSVVERAKIAVQPQDSPLKLIADTKTVGIGEMVSIQARMVKVEEKSERTITRTSQKVAFRTVTVKDKSDEISLSLWRDSASQDLIVGRTYNIYNLKTSVYNQRILLNNTYSTRFELVEEQDKKISVYVLVVYLSGGDASSQNLQNSSNGWTVSRRLSEFHTLHENLCQIGPWLKKKDLPSAGLFTTIDEKFIEESKKTLTNYLEVILKDERMAHSEALYAFLSPSPEYLKQNKSEKGNFFLRNLLKKLPSRQPEQHDSDDEEESKLDRTVDSIAEPFYKLVNEIFESRGMFKWLRKSFIMFVEVTFGRTINRQLSETVDWMFSESMIIYYIQQFTLSMWPDGKLAETEPSRSDEEKLKTRMEAKEKFLQNMPDALKTLLGEDNGRRGTIKIFEVLQDTRLNKQLFYELLNLLTLELCPEIKEKKPFIPDTTKETKF